jgi:hypothetical protein
MERTYTCGTCHQTVPVGHFHESDTRVCEDCQQELPIGGFPKWQSAFDGHRKQCSACTKARNRRHADDQRVARTASRDEENRLLSEHGYRWHPRFVHGEKTWELVDPQGQTVSKQAALTSVYTTLYGDDYFDDPW